MAMFRWDHFPDVWSGSQQFEWCSAAAGGHTRATRKGLCDVRRVCPPPATICLCLMAADSLPWTGAALTGLWIKAALELFPEKPLKSSWFSFDALKNFFFKFCRESTGNTSNSLCRSPPFFKLLYLSFFLLCVVQRLCHFFPPPSRCLELPRWLTIKNSKE